MPHVFSLITTVFLAYQNVYQFTYTEHRAPDDDKALRKQRSSVWKSLHFSLLALGILDVAP